jgi:hypothetical protein
MIHFSPDASEIRIAAANSAGDDQGHGKETAREAAADR